MRLNVIRVVFYIFLSLTISLNLIISLFYVIIIKNLCSDYEKFLLNYTSCIRSVKYTLRKEF